METIKSHAQQIIKEVLKDNMPRQAVITALENHKFSGNIHLVAVGKAAWTMTEAAVDFLGDKLKSGIIVTKYDHSFGPLPNIEIYESGHPVSDENTIIATQKCVQLAEKLTAGDELLFLISGGGSALFESPHDGISLEDLQDVTKQLLAGGADIVEMNMVRKRFSKVKAGGFASLAAPAKIFAIVLSDVLGDRLDSIASGPAAPDQSTKEDALKVVEKYNLKLTDAQNKYLLKETPKTVDNVETVITGSVRTLCESASKIARELGYTPYVLTTTLNCEASEAGRMLASIAADVQGEAGLSGQAGQVGQVGQNSAFKRPCAIIAGGETVVTIKGSGKGGRNQELALAAARGISSLENTVIFSLGSDGTDGPTDAAGGIVDTKSLAQLKEQGLNIDKILSDNDSYNGLKAIDGLIMTGPTGTNVNDVAVVLCG